jgi:hypothetical protein
MNTPITTSTEERLPRIDVLDRPEETALVAVIGPNPADEARRALDAIGLRGAVESCPGAALAQSGTARIRSALDGRLLIGGLGRLARAGEERVALHALALACAERLDFGLELALAGASRRLGGGDWALVGAWAGEPGHLAVVNNGIRLVAGEAPGRMLVATSLLAIPDDAERIRGLDRHGSFALRVERPHRRFAGGRRLTWPHGTHPVAQGTVGKAR